MQCTLSCIVQYTEVHAQSDKLHGKACLMNVNRGKHCQLSSTNDAPVHHTKHQSMLSWVNYTLQWPTCQLAQHDQILNTSKLTPTSVIFARNASDRCRFRVWLSATDIKSQKNSCGPRNNGRGHTPDSRDGNVNLSWRLTANMTTINSSLLHSVSKHLSKKLEDFVRSKFLLMEISSTFKTIETRWGSDS